MEECSNIDKHETLGVAMIKVDESRKGDEVINLKEIGVSRASSQALKLLMLVATLLRGEAAESVIVTDTCELEATDVTRWRRVKFCDVVEPMVLTIMLTVTIVQSMLICYSLPAKRFEGNKEPEGDDEMPV